ncbi:hypothetical protein K492DRAFT_159934 [Lichtheimia hyalospora FSU 10163]|nr:hypothetical protein K492DRAFT_159934 [Lichtheimia hyalospora FSU 10163]
MSTTVQSMPRYFCYACNGEVPIYLTPDPTCQLCNDQFVQEVEPGINDPRSFFTSGDDISHTPRRPMHSTGSTPFDSVENEYIALARQSFDDRDHHQERSISSTATDVDMFPEYFRNLMSSVLDTSMGRELPFRLLHATAIDHIERYGVSLERQETRNDDTSASYQTRSTTSTENEPLRPNVFGSALYQLLHGMGMPNDGFAGNFDDYAFTQADLDRIMTRLMNQSNGNAPPPTPANVIDTLPVRQLSEKEIADQVDCAVCKDEYTQNDHVMELECTHFFHPDCIKPWLKINGTCPVCRKVIDGSKDKQGSNGSNNVTEVQTSASTISSFFDTTRRRLFGNGPSSSSETRQNTSTPTTSNMPGSYTNNDSLYARTPSRRPRFDPNSDYMNLDLD